MRENAYSSLLLLHSIPALSLFEKLDELQVKSNMHEYLKILSTHSTTKYLKIYFTMVFVTFISLVSYFHFCGYIYVQIVSDIII